MILISIGLAGGIAIGLMTYSPSTMDMFGKKNPAAQSRLRAGSAALAAAAAAAVPAAAKAKTTMQERKQTFLEHKADIGTSGKFPYLGPTVSANHDFSRFTAPGGHRFEEYKFGDSPYTYEKGESDAVAISRRAHVKRAMQHAWKGYETYAFGRDELLPETLKGHDNWGGMGTTLVDSLDTLWLMNMTEEFQRARDWCDSKLTHNRPRKVSVFETTIRSLGGLLSAYDWSQDPVFLRHAEDLGRRLFKAFDNPSGIPWGQINLSTGEHSNLGWTGNSAIISEVGTLQIEFRLLARLTGNEEYKKKSERVFFILRSMAPPDGLYPYFIRNRGAKPEFANHKLTFGAMSDSLYEYMLKIWLQGGRTEFLYREMYDKSIQGMHDKLLQVSSPTGLVYIADENSGTLDTKMDHLVCFMGGLLALGAYTDPLGLESERAQRDLKTAKALTYTCYQMYARMPTGISPEFIQVHEGSDFDIGRGAPHYLLRPEAVESFFVLYHLTGDPVYREWGWEVFQAIERYCRTEGGYGSLHDVTRVGAQPDNKMESFFLAETLKYLYLLFDPETPIDLLNKHVINTEAHPVRIFQAMDEAGVMDLLKTPK